MTSQIKGIENHEKTSCIFLDFAKAFDSVNHEILLKKLDHYGLRGIGLEWFQSYLTNRFQAVNLGRYLSEFQTITCRTPQGSVLGALLFLIYINDISTLFKKRLWFSCEFCEIFKNTFFTEHLRTTGSNIYISASKLKFYLFADDTCIFYPNKDQLERGLYTSLENISSWIKANKPTLNVKKSDLLLFNLS